MEHHFNVRIASLYGIEEAILIDNLFFWINKNAANNKHYHEGRYWTYNSIKSLTELFPYMSPDKIKRVIKNLVTKGVILKGNFNELTYDRTCWYAFGDSALCILQNEGFHWAKSPNGMGENNQPIPYTNTYTNTDINTIPPPRTREDRILSNSEFSDKLLIETFEEVKRDQSWAEVIIMNNRSAGHKNLTPDEFLRQLNVFLQKLQNEGETHKSPRDLKSHFARWLKIELEKQKTNGAPKTNKRDSNETANIEQYKPKSLKF